MYIEAEYGAKPLFNTAGIVRTSIHATRLLETKREKEKSHDLRKKTAKYRKQIESKERPRYVCVCMSPVSNQTPGCALGGGECVEVENDAGAYSTGSARRLFKSIKDAAAKAAHQPTSFQSRC